MAKANLDGSQSVEISNRLATDKPSKNRTHISDGLSVNKLWRELLGELPTELPTDILSGICRECTTEPIDGVSVT